MNEMKTVVWDGEPRTIPKYGCVERGTEISLPIDIANSFKAQGLLEEKLVVEVVAEKKTTKSKTKTEGDS